jgi:DNA topoisomerase VI subunit B
MPLTAEEKAALRDWRDSHGKRWRLLLADAWSKGQTSGVLQFLRNAAHFEPAGLVRLKPDDLE